MTGLSKCLFSKKTHKMTKLLLVLSENQVLEKGSFSCRMAKNRNNYIHFRTCLLEPKLPTFYLLTKELTKQIEMNALPLFS